MPSIVLLMLTLWSPVESCGKHQRLFYCKKTANIPERRCSGVSPRPCPLYTFRCPCAGSHFLNNANKCVKNCETPGDWTSGESPSPIPKRRQSIEIISSNAKMVLKSGSPLHLLQISMETWIDFSCECLKSTYQALVDRKPRRVVACYNRLKLPGRDNLMMRSHTQLDFDVLVRDNAVFMRLEDPGEKPLPFDLRDTYEVLSADETCIVLQTGEHENGKPYCMLWGLENDDDKKEDECFHTIEKACVSETFRVWERNDRCAHHDRLAIAAEEAISQHMAQRDMH